jgi:NAD(P)-dependent dehydrogenase (short-subunit alcohol dehydrogenase family)
METKPSRTGLRSFRGAVVLITGGASGIGAALGRVLAAQGATVLLADRQAEAAEQEAARLREVGGSAAGLAVDVREAAAVEELVEGAFARHGRVDYLFNNAGIGVGGEACEHTLDDWRYIVEVNLMGVVHGVQAAYPRMVRQGFGHIVNTASVAGLASSPGTTAYSMTKHAVVGLSRSLRIEAAEHGVRVSAICPGPIRTPILIDGGTYGRMTRPVPQRLQEQLWEQLAPMDADLFALRAIEQVRRNRAIIIEPWYWRLAWWLERLSPALADLVAAAGYRRMRALVEEARGGGQ